MEYINVTEAARRLQISDKTIRRAIHKGLLPARYPKKNLCEVAIDDLQAWRSASLAPSTEDMRREITQLSQRVAELELHCMEQEQRLAILEVQLQLLVNTAASPQPAQRSTPPSIVIEGIPHRVPDGYVPLKAFADLHGISRNEADRRWKAGFISGLKDRGPFPPTGRSQRGTVVFVNAQGKRDFWVQFHETPGFRACDDCPHTSH